MIKNGAAFVIVTILLASADELPDFTTIDPATVKAAPVPARKDPKTGFIIAGKNDTALIEKLTEMNERSIADLEKDMRPGALSRGGFIGKDEKLLAVLAMDNRYVVDERKLTHQELARHLRILGGIGFKLKAVKQKSKPFLYHGRRFQISLMVARGLQPSPFEDGTKSGANVTLFNLDNGKGLQYALLVPEMIERYGFYEGKGTPYRVDPRKILEVLDFLPLKKIGRIGGDFIQHLSWSADGKHFLFTRIHQGKMGLWTMPVGGGEPRRLLPGENMPHFDGHFSPDGKRVLFVYDRLQGTDGKLQIDVTNADGSEHKNLIPHAAFEESPRWSPDGKRLVWASTRDKKQAVYVADADGTNVKRLTDAAVMDNTPSWSPDGKQIVFTSGRSGNLDICLMNADGSNVRRLTTNPTLDYWPIFAPDGKRMAFTTNRDGNYEIYVMNADGSGQHNLTRHPAHDNFAAWSPDGSRIAFISNREGTYEIHALAVR